MARFTMMLALAFLATCSTSVQAIRLQFHQQILEPLSISGRTTIYAQLERNDNRLNDTLTEFSDYNKTVCAPIIASKIAKCAACVSAQCTKRAQDLRCPQAGLVSSTSLVGPVEDFIAKTIPNYYMDEEKRAGFMAAFLTTVGFGVINGLLESPVVQGLIAQGISEVTTVLTDTLTNVITDLAVTGINAITPQIESFVTNLSNTIISGVSDVTQLISGNLIGNIGSALSGVLSSIIKPIANLFGKRRRSLYAAEAGRALTWRRAKAPLCTDLGSAASIKGACMFYRDSCAKLGSCDISRDRDCPSWSAKLRAYKKASDDSEWVCHLEDLNYSVTEVDYDPKSWDPALTAYRNVKVTSQVFGKSVTFAMADPVNPFDAPRAGALIAKYAYQSFRDSVAHLPCPAA